MGYVEVANEALGWLHDEEGPALYEYGSMAARIAPLCEIGGYGGKSACWLGEAAKNQSSLLFSVDWHRGSPEMKPGRECHHPEMVGKDGVFDSLPYFRATVRKANLEPWVVPIAGDSKRIGPFWHTDLGLLFIDGGHDGATVASDYWHWAPWVVDGGYLLFHDTPIPEIDAVAQQATEQGFKLVEQIQSLRVLQRIVL